MKVLNLGCGWKTSSHADVINLDWSIQIRARARPLFRVALSRVLSGDRKRKFDSLPENVLPHDMSRGLPFTDNSVDAVYHSHLLEHLDRDVVPGFLKEIYRVLKPNGVHRMAVPDLERLVRAYVASLHRADEGVDQAIVGHERTIAAMFDQCVRREWSITREMDPWKRSLVTAILGDAWKRGEAHRWMYDRISLSKLLRDSGFVEVAVKPFNCSALGSWRAYGLEVNHDGTEYKSDSLYLECRKH